MQAMKRNKLRNAISVAIALSATSLTGMAFAQNGQTHLKAMKPKRWTPLSLPVPASEARP